MYSPLNAISSSQTGVIAVPDSPDRRTAAYNNNNDSTSGVHDIDKAKSESPELSASVHEFPSSSAPSRTNDTAIQTQTLDDPIMLSSLVNSSEPLRANARAPPENRLAVASSSELQERAVPMEVLRRSPFLKHFSTHAVPREPALNISGLRQRTPNHAEGIESQEVRTQSPLMHESKEQPPPAWSPIKIRVSGRVLSSLQPDSPIIGATYGESSLSGIQRELSFGPGISIGSGTRSPNSNVQQWPTDHHPVAEEVPSEGSLSEVVEHQATPELGNAICKATQTADEALTKKGPEPDRFSSPHPLTPVAIDQQSPDEEAHTETEAPKADERRSMSLIADSSNIPSVPMRVLQLRESAEDNRGGSSSSQKSVLSSIRENPKPKDKTRKAPRNGPEIISIEETEDEQPAVQPLPINEKVVQKPDIWAVPSDTEEKLKFKSTGKRNHTPSWGVTPRKSVDRKKARSQTEERQPESTRSMEEKPTDPEIVPEKERYEREKKDKVNARKRQRVAERKAEQANLAEKLKVDDVKANKDDRGRREDLETAVIEPNAVAKSARTRGKILSAKTAGNNELKKANPAKFNAVATSQGDLDPRKKIVPEIGQSLHTGRNTKDAAKRAVPNAEASEAQKAKKSKVSMVKESQQLWAERKAIQEAEMAAREAEAIAHAQRSVKVPSKKPATRIADESISETGSRNETEPNLRGPSQTSRRTSATPSNRRDAALKRRSMTPLFPSTTMKPVKSALRSSETSIRRSVSFNDEAVALTSPTLMTAKAARPLRDSNMPATAGTAAKRGDPQQLELCSSPSDRAAKKRESDMSANSKLRGSSSSKSVTPSTNASSKIKVQTKLNVIRDVKLKGREIETPCPPKPVTLAENEEIIISSDSERSASTFYSDEEDRTRSAKAGPSSKKKLSSSMNLDGGITSSRATTSRSNSVSTSNIVRKEENKTPLTAISVEGSSDKDPREMSTPRSPAQYISRASSAQSQSGSSIGSRTISEHGSEVDAESRDGSESESGSDDDTQTSDQLSSASRSKLGSGRNSSQPKDSKDTDIQTLAKPPQGRAASAENSIISEESGSEEEDEDLAIQMEQQLQRDCRQTTEPPKRTKQPTLPLVKPATHEAAPEPSNTRFPSLSGLRSRASKTTANTAVTQRPTTLATSSGTRRGTIQSTQTRSRSSTSESDESSSSSDDDSDEATMASQDAKRPSSTLKGIGKIIRRTFLF